MPFLTPFLVGRVPLLKQTAEGKQIGYQLIPTSLLQDLELKDQCKRRCFNFVSLGHWPMAGGAQVTRVQVLVRRTQSLVMVPILVLRSLGLGNVFFFLRAPLFGGSKGNPKRKPHSSPLQSKPPIWAMGQNPNRTPSEHPNPTTQISTKMGGEFTYQPKMGSHWF